MCPQEPQLLGSVAVFMQVPPQQLWPDEQVETHVPVVESHVKHRLVLQGALMQTEPQTFAFGQHVSPRHV
jgi:hypothetical protein